GRTNVIKLLLKRQDVDVNRRTPNGRTALHFAARLVNMDAATLLAQADGVNVEARNNIGMTPLALAVAQSEVKSVAYLIDDLKFDIHTRDDKGRSLTLIAAAHSGIHMLKELLNRGFDVNDKDSEGKTPLVHYAE
ncbi:ankyrin, partial [Amniculicola lignicola CBS 123094]